MGAQLELKATLNLPKTDFSMKANLPQNEPKWLEKWEHLRIYEQIRQARKGAPKYILHDGPPYANGPIHLGTALNKCLKDFVVKSKTMAGFDSPYVPGWDCHGLPIEIKVDEDLGRKKLAMHPLEVRKACRSYAQKYLDVQREQFKRIGVFGQFDRPYSTMSKQYESVIAKTFFKFLEDGAVYKGLKPVYWCWFDKTALAEAEVEYGMHSSPSIWVKYALTSDPAKIDSGLAGKKVNTIIWTTTPWTLPASMALAFHPQFHYLALEDAATGEVYIVADRLAEVTKQKCNLQKTTLIASFKGGRLERATFQHPFLDRSILGVLADYVTSDQGTGAVHTAPAHGVDDFYTGAKYGLDQSCNVDEAGRLRNGLPEYDGKTVFQANPHIVELLKSRAALLNEEKIEHSYPHCWRCHNPVIFRATEQWFISMEAPVGNSGKTLRQRALEEIKGVTWDPLWGEQRISNMIATRPDWCISRQRVWGVPIAVFFCEGCAAVLKSQAVNRAVIDLFAQKGADSWYTQDAGSILPPGTKCDHCGGTAFRKEMDIIDVWFESGSSHEAVLREEDGLRWPADLYTEGSDQYRGWFHSSLLCAIGTRNRSPYKKVATSGWTLDPQGRAMSKSLGNTVDPVDIARRMGGEIVRLWVASVDFREDVHASEELMQRAAENYRKIRNTFRFILGNLAGFDPSNDAVPFTEMEPFDQYQLLRLAEINNKLKQWYEGFEFHRVYHQVNEYCTVDLSAVYFDILKDRLYTFAPRSKSRRSAQTAIWKIGEALVRLLAPLMSFTAEEVWKFLPQVAGRASSVHLTTFPDHNEILENVAVNPLLRTDWDALLSVRNEALRALENARKEKIIGSGLEAKVKLAASDPLAALLQKYERQLPGLLIVSQVKLQNDVGGNGASVLKVEVTPAEGVKCERCWNYSVHVGENPQYPTVCERCTATLSEMENSNTGSTFA